MSLWQRPNGPTTLAASSTSLPALNAQANQTPTLPAALTLTGTAATILPNPQNTAIALILPLPGNGGNEQIPFDLIASGIVTTTNTSTFTITLYNGTSLTVGSNTSMGASSGASLASLTTNWRVKAELLYDSVSGKLTGTVEFLLNNVITAKAAISSIITGIKDQPASGNAVTNFVLGFTSSAASAPNPTTVSVKSFSVG